MFGSEHTAGKQIAGVCWCHFGRRKGGAMSIKRGKPRHRLVNINKPAELRAWAKYWGCTQLDVRDAVKIAGVTPEDVRDWLMINVVR